jgi:hypothetical protein
MTGYRGGYRVHQTIMGQATISGRELPQTYVSIADGNAALREISTRRHNADVVISPSDRYSTVDGSLTVAVYWGTRTDVYTLEPTDITAYINARDEQGVLT